MESGAPQEYLQELLGKRLHLYTSDSRMFVGEFKCTDNECNIILGAAFEYREPSRKAIEAAASEIDADASAASKFRVDMTSRFLGLIVVPGQHITMIKLEDT